MPTPTIIGVMSDTHSNAKLMFSVADAMKTTYGVQIIVHLGDDFHDAEELSMAAYDVRSVPGLWCSAYRDHRIPSIREEIIDGIRFVCAHADQDALRVNCDGAVVLVGHTHGAAISRRGHSLWINPGHLKSAISRGERASFAVITLDKQTLQVDIRETDGRLRKSKVCSRALFTNSHTAGA